MYFGGAFGKWLLLEICCGVCLFCRRSVIRKWSLLKEMFVISCLIKISVLLCGSRVRSKAHLDFRLVLGFGVGLHRFLRYSLGFFAGWGVVISIV